MGANKRHFVIYDLETQNSNPNCPKTEIVQIAAVTARYQDYELHPDIEPFEIILKPEKPENAHPDAIKVIGQDLWDRALSEGVSPKVGLRKFKEYLNRSNISGKYWDAPILTGFNTLRYDDPLLLNSMVRHKVIKGHDDCPWAYMGYDLMPMLHSIFGRDTGMQNHKLDTYLDMFDLSRKGNTHDAVEDVMLTYELFKRYMRFMTGKIRDKIKIVPANTSVSV
jgi:DNA polymerase III epsilon subunit-like protein